MQVTCPHCEGVLVLKGAAPGRYSPVCTLCRQKFRLFVDPDLTVHVARMTPKPEADKVSHDIALALGIPATRSAPPPQPRPAMTIRPVGQQSMAGIEVPEAGQTAMDMPALPMAGSTAAGATVPPPAAAILPPQPVPRPTTESPVATLAPTPSGEAQRLAVTAPPTGVGVTPTVMPATELPPGSDVPQTLGGYRIVSKLGQGGMGAVYRAHQVSLDRDVAVKIMNRHWSRDADFVARFTREAFAAAQLVHHNVVQIYDIGAEQETHYFSMELVRGQSLAQIFEREGRLVPDVAAGYILQAARALKFAHSHGMIHRDIKPDNLLLNDQGILKVVDLGLVKTPGSRDASQRSKYDADVRTTGHTLAAASMGTPAYMPPEQAVDAAHVDSRADIYSLGCTFYQLVTGRLPFAGKTADETIQMHLKQSPTPPDQLVPNVPRSLSAAILRMMAKRPDDRYANMGQVIEAIEDFLGVEGPATFTPREHHVRELEQMVRQFNAAPAARARGKVFGLFTALTLLGFAATVWNGWFVASGGLAALLVLTPLSHFLISGVANRTHLYIKARQLVLTSSLADWAVTIIGLALILVALVVLELLWIWMAFFLAAVLLGTVFYIMLDRQTAGQRCDVLGRIEQMLKGMRIKGMDEDSIRHFVSRYGGPRWEELYETLFGYESKVMARARWGRAEHVAGRKYAAWRDPVVRWIDQKIEMRQEQRQREHLQKVEAKRLAAKGLSELEAGRKARKIADAMVDRAAEMRRPDTRINAQEASADKAGGGVVIVTNIFADLDEQSPKYRRRGYIARRVGGPLDIIFGQHLRFIVGAVILTLFFGWVYRNRSAVTDEVKAVSKAHRVDDGSLVSRGEQKAIATERPDAAPHKVTPLDLPLLPQKFNDVRSPWNVGLAGAILVLGALFRGRALGAALYIAAVLMLVGPGLPLPAIAGLSTSGAALALGLLAALIGIFFLRETEGY